MIISSDEGGSSDYLTFITRDDNLFGGFIEKAIYSFEQVILYANSIKLIPEIENLLGFGSKYLSIHEFEAGIQIPLRGLYTANNFFYGDDKGQVEYNLIEEAPIGELKNNTGEFWNMIFHIDGIDFTGNFYRKIQQGGKVNHFSYLKKMEFYDKERITNRFEWLTTEGFNYWKHASDDGFYNCENPKFYAYQLLMSKT